jgi:hypothetical protein
MTNITLKGHDIYGLKAVNDGEIWLFENIKDPFNENKQLILEVLRPDFYHKDSYIVSYYYYDKKLSAKMEVTLYRDKGIWGSEVYYFKKPDSLHHYTSRNYDNFIGIPKKYMDIVKYIHPAFTELFGI